MAGTRTVLRAKVRGGVAMLATPLLPRLGYGSAWALLAVSHRAAVGPRASGVLLREAERRVAAGDLAGGYGLLRAIAAGDVAAVRTVLAPLDRLRAAGAADLAVELWRELALRHDLSEQLRWRTRHGLGRALAELGRTDEAIQHLRAAVEAVPDRSSWRHELLVLAARSGATATVSAVFHAGSLVGLRPAQVDELLEVFEDEGVLSEAVAALADGAVAADVLPLVRRAARTGTGEVVEMVAGALPAAVDRARVWDTSGRLHGRAKRWAAATKAYERAIEETPDDAALARRLGAARRRADLALQGLPDTLSGQAGLTVSPERGMVTIKDGVLTGLLPPMVDHGSEVRVTINGRVVARTHAAALPAEEGPAAFRRAVRDLWYFAGHGDVVEVIHDGGPLPFPNGEETLVVSDPRPSAVAGLFSRLDEGHVLNKYGKLRRSIKVDERWQADVFDLFERLRADLREAGGVELFPFYGTMLGAVREGHFLGHDNDFDAVYISQRSDPAAVKGEFLALCSHLVERGYEVQARSWHVWVHGPRRNVRVDIFFAWFDDTNRFQVSYGYHGEPVLRSHAFSTWRMGQLGRYHIPIPDNAEQLLEQLYGPGWRHPDPGFSHYASTRRLHPAYRLTTDERNRIYWRQFYRDHQIEGGSSFANFVYQRFPEMHQVIELGCGTGRDSVFLAGRGKRVVAADRSPEAIERAREARSHAGVDGLDFAVVDASDRAELARFLAGIRVADGTELLVYLRFFLHSIPEAVEDTLLGTLTDVLPAGFHLCAEFRTAEDERRAKVFGDHYRRYIDEEAFVTKLSERWGFEVEHLEAGTGLSPFQGEDPHLARVIARAAPSA